MTRRRIGTVFLCGGITLGLVVVCSAIGGWAIFRRPDLENIPVQRLLENLQQQVTKQPNDPQLQQNLARVHGMAYALKADELAVEKNTPELPWFGSIPPHVPQHRLVEIDATLAQSQGWDAATVAARKKSARDHLDQSIAHYRRAAELDPTNLTVRLGLAWSLDQAGQTEEALTLYREVIEQGWDQEKELKIAGLKFQSIVREAAEYLQPHLDPASDQAELQELQNKVAQVQKIRRPVTPLAIPLAADHSWTAVADLQARVRFDADGSGERRDWTWIRPQAAWLVFDPRGTGQIDSALQWFGSVSFWCFWDNGFQALSALDDNGDNVLAHDELDGLGVWRDANQNGRSEPGEVVPVSGLSIAQIRCDSWTAPAGTPLAAWHPAGIVRLDGSTLPIYDLLLQPVADSSPSHWPFSPPDRWKE